MSVINPLAQEISAKIVYYGPGLSGKTTTLKYIFSVVRPERRGDLVSLATEGDRTIFFDFLPLHVERIQSMTLRLQLYTVPGQVFYAATRKLVLNGADGVVFVADSQLQSREPNMESYQSLSQNLGELGIDISSFPVVFQYNKRDLPNLIPVEQMARDLNTLNAPAFETAATTGMGVIPAVKEIVRLVVRSLWAQPPKPRPVLVDEPAPADESLADRISKIPALALDSEPKIYEAEPKRPPSVVPPGTRGISFAPLWKGNDPKVIHDIEKAVAHGEYSEAVRFSTSALAELLESLPGPGSVAAKAALLGVDGREYLRLCRMAAAPGEAVTEQDALFSLYILVGAQLKSTPV